MEFYNNFFRYFYQSQFLLKHFFHIRIRVWMKRLSFLQKLYLKNVLKSIKGVLFLWPLGWLIYYMQSFRFTFQINNTVLVSILIKIRNIKVMDAVRLYMGPNGSSVTHGSRVALLNDTSGHSNSSVITLIAFLHNSPRLSAKCTKACFGTL